MFNLCFLFITIKIVISTGTAKIQNSKISLSTSKNSYNKYKAPIKIPGITINFFIRLNTLSLFLYIAKQYAIIATINVIIIALINSLLSNKSDINSPHIANSKIAKVKTLIISSKIFFNFEDSDKLTYNIKTKAIPKANINTICLYS